MDFHRDYPEPEEAVDALIQHASGDGEGVLRDTLVEANSTANDYQTQMEEVNVLLDYVCDDTSGVLPASMEAELRECQRLAQYTANWLDEFTLEAKKAHDERFK